MNSKQMKYKTSFRKKEIINSILSRENGDCKHKINARYEWKRSDQILTVYLSPKNTFEVGINLNIGRQKKFGNTIEEPAMEMIYRAYFISAYIRCLDDATSIVPQSYFSGLVLLCAVNSLCAGKKVKVFSPLERKPPELRPIDVYCAIQALTRLIIDCAERISEKSRNAVVGNISELLAYSMLPEISYKGDEVVYSVLHEIRKLWENTASHRCSLDDYKVFNELGKRGLLDLCINEFMLICERSKNLFWGNLVIRLSAHIGVWKSIVIEKESFITSCIRHFGEDSVKYYRDTRQTENQLLVDNFMAIKFLSRMIEQAFSIVTANVGQIHYFQ